MHSISYTRGTNHLELQTHAAQECVLCDDGRMSSLKFHHRSVFSTHVVISTPFTLFISSSLSLSPSSPQPLPPSGTLVMQAFISSRSSHPSVFSFCPFFTVPFAQHFAAPPSAAPSLALPLGPPLSNKRLHTCRRRESGGWGVAGEVTQGHANTHVSPVPLTPVRRERLSVAVTPRDTPP